jgi:hypothetical protein
MAVAPPARIYGRDEVELMDVPEKNDEDEEELSPSFAYYNSVKILGKLYRAIDEKKIWTEDVKRPVPSTHGSPSIWNEFAGLTKRNIKEFEIGDFDWEGKRDLAWQLRNV